MNKTDVWMPLYIADYLADTQHLTRDEHGGYLLLLMAYWRNGGGLQDDDKRLAAIVKATPKEWAAMRPTLAEFFTVEDGFWIHGRADTELQRAHANVAQRSEAGKASAAKRKAQRNSNERCNEIPTSVATDDQRDTQRNGKPSPSPTPKNKTGDPPESGGNTPREEFHPTLPVASAPPALGRTQLSQEFEPDVPNCRTAVGLGLDAQAERERFVAHYTATGDWRANWQAQFRKWLLDSMQHQAEAAKRQRAPGRNPNPGQASADAAQRWLQSQTSEEVEHEAQG